MIDTVILTVLDARRYVYDDSRFSIPLDSLMRTHKYGVKSHCNPSKEDLEAGVYLPRITAYKRHGAICLRIEFSIPKLTHGNNLEEVDENSFSQVVSLLGLALRKMGVSVPESVLQAAPVSGFHPSKNIQLTGGYTASMVVRELSKVDVTARLEITEQRFTQGNAVQFYSKSYSIAFYDKVAEVQQSARPVVHPFPSRNILRMKVRLAHQKKVSSLLHQLGYPFAEHPTFENIFKEKVCQNILLYYWKFILPDKHRFLFDSDNDDQRILRRILATSPGIKPKKVPYLFSLYYLTQEQGIRNIGDFFTSNFSRGRWLAMKRDFETFSAKEFHEHPYQYLRDIERELNEFRPLRL